MRTYQEAKDTAARTLLTEEAKTHLGAAAMELEEKSFGVTGILSAIRARLDNGRVGEAVTLSDQEAGEIAEALRGVERLIQADLIEPVFSRRRGERPHREGRYLLLDEEAVRELVTDLYRIGYATILEKDSDEAEIRRRLDAISKLSEALADRVCEAAGIPVHDGTMQEFLDAARSFGPKAAKLGREAVETVEVEA